MDSLENLIVEKQHNGLLRFRFADSLNFIELPAETSLAIAKISELLGCSLNHALMHCLVTGTKIINIGMNSNNVSKNSDGTINVRVMFP